MDTRPVRRMDGPDADCCASPDCRPGLRPRAARPVLPEGIALPPTAKSRHGIRYLLRTGTDLGLRSGLPNWRLNRTDRDRFGDPQRNRAWDGITVGDSAWSALSTRT